MDIAKGDYISFVDADDYLELDFCKELLSVAQKEKSDIICCSDRKYLPDGRLLSPGKNDHAVLSFSRDRFEYGEEKEKMLCFLPRRFALLEGLHTLTGYYIIILFWIIPHIEDVFLIESQRKLMPGNRYVKIL